MIKSVVSEFHWEPEKIGKLFLDAQDYLGLEFWYDFVLTLNKPNKKR